MRCVKAHYISFEGHFAEYYARMTCKLFCVASVFLVVTGSGKLGLCRLICRARTFLLLAVLLRQHLRMVDFYLGNSWLISRSAKQPLGQPTGI